MKFDDLKKKTPQDLVREMDTATFDLMRFNAQVATGGIGKDAGKIKELKKKIARIKTLQQLAGSKAPTKASTTPSTRLTKLTRRNKRTQ